MRWDHVVEATLQAVESDPILSALFGNHVYRSGDRDFAVPSLDWTLFSDVETDRFNPLRILWDVFTRADEDQISAERALRRLFHRDLPVVISGVRMWAEYAGRVEIQGLPDGIRGSATDFVFTPIRSRYLRAPVES